MTNVQEVRSALSYISAVDRNTWIRMGMAIKSDLGKTGFSVFNEWSQSADNYRECDALSVWKSLKGHGITKKSIFKLAREHGWRSDVQTNFPAMIEVTAPKDNRDLSGYAKSIWASVDCEDKHVASHPYCQRKQVNHAFGAGRSNVSGKLIGKDSDCIIVPVRKGGIGEVQAVHCINCHGKQTFGSMDGCYLLLGNETDSQSSWWVLEGWASGYSMHMIERNAVTCIAFGLSRMENVANMVAKAFKPNSLILLKDAA